MRDLAPELIASTERMQDMSFELSAEIDEFLDNHTSNKDVADAREFLADRYAALQAYIDSLRDGSLLVEDGN